MAYLGRCKEKDTATEQETDAPTVTEIRVGDMNVALQGTPQGSLIQQHQCSYRNEPRLFNSQKQGNLSYHFSDTRFLLVTASHRHSPLLCKIPTPYKHLQQVIYKVIFLPNWTILISTNVSKFYSPTGFICDLPEPGLPVTVAFLNFYYSFGSQP